jgi:DNA polymerase III delta prime subunit
MKSPACRASEMRVSMAESPPYGAMPHRTRAMSSPSSAVVAALQRWRSDLLDLSHRNPLLHLKPRRSCLLTISQPDPQAILEQLRAGKSWSFWLPTTEENRQRGQPETNELVCADLDRAELLHVLTGLYRWALTDYQELGLYLLHLALGVLEWRDDDGQTFHSPLVLLPVELARPSLHEPFRLTQAEDAFLNPALQTRLLQDFDFRLPPFDPDGKKTLTTHLEEVREAIAGLPGWQGESAALLTRFPFFKGVTHQDLLDNAQRMAEHPLVRALAGVPSSETFARIEAPDEHELDEVPPPEEAFHVLDADSSQRRCLEAASRGQSLVLLGPPGTGKSQTIANLIADCLARGKTVLFVSEKMAALDVVHQRLCQVGLDDFCLELHSHKANKRVVIAELLRCLELPAEPPPAVPPADSERLRQCRQQLSVYVDALHRPREPLQQSVWWALGELARCHDLPALPLTLPEGTELTAAWLEEARQALERARQLWHVRKDPDFPWRGFKLERYNLQLRDEVIGLIDKARTRLDRLLAVAQEYGRQLGVTGSVAWLLKLDELLEATPKPPSQWLTADDLSELAADLDRCAASHQGQGAARGPLTAKYGSGIWQLPEGTAAQLEETWRQVRLLLAPSDEAGANFLKLQQQLRGWAADTQRRVPGWLTEARTLEKWLGVPLPVGAAASVAGAETLGSSDPGTNRGFAAPAPAAQADKLGPSLAMLRRLLRLANLCQSDTPPERAWVLDPAARQKAQTLIAQVRPDFTAYRQGKAALLERYTEDFFELDLERMGKAFDGFYRSFLRIFSASYRRDRRSIRRRTRTRTVLPTMADDVRAGRDLVVMQRRLEEQTAERRPVLGRYEKGLDTALDAAERAIKVAAEALELVRQLKCETVPERLADALCAPGPPPEKVRAAARRLHDSLAAWWQHTQELRAVLPLDLFPQVGQPLEEAALSALVHYGQQLQAALNRFAVLADPVLSRAVVPPPDIVTFLQDLREAERQRAAETIASTAAARWQARFGPGFRGLATDWEALKKSLSWVQKLRGLFPGPLPEPILRIATGAAPAPPSRELRTARDQAQQAIHSLEIRFEPDERRGVSPPVEDQQQWLGLLRQRITGLADWSDWKLLQRRFEHLGLAAYWEQLQQAEVPADRLADVFLKSALTHWLEPILREDPALAAFRRTDHERIVEEFREQDRLLIRQAAVRVAQQAEARRREAAGPELEAERTLLLREAHNKGRPLPLRLLFEQIPGLLRRLKPCLLTNPLSVSQFFPAEIVFDLVIFDEASQIATEDAIGAISRGRQAVIVGDDKQLPPTSSFQQNLLDDEQEEVQEAPALFESVLDACLRAGLPSYLLRCHYRSRHEGLIAYSNQSFYDGRLITFPAPSLSASVELRHVPDGVYDHGGRRGNRREAEVVADLVFEHFQKHGDKKTLGVITFSQAQMTAIADEVERRLRDRPNLEPFFKPDRLEGFFVKNLETAQGDERDVILLSIDYGPNASGRLTMHFGPISGEGGERRLNVAITRARERLVIVSSIHAADIDPAATKTAGMAHLRAYLEYVERGPAASAPVEEALPALERDLLAEVRRLGYEAEVQVGSSEYRLDVAVRAPGPDGRFVLGIQTDGLSYRAAATARDRDRLWPEALEKLGWRLYRVWSPAWVEHREEELAALRQAVEQANRADS